jgi:hypothetical protein
MGFEMKSLKQITIELLEKLLQKQIENYNGFKDESEIIKELTDLIERLKNETTNN